MEKRTVLICGAGGGGIGIATSLTLAREGVDIVAVDHAQDLVDETVRQVTSLGVVCRGIVADLRDPAQRGTIVSRAVEMAGTIHGVANIAGGMTSAQWGRFEGTPDEVWRTVMALNLDYVFTICRDAAAHMIERNIAGAFVNIASVSALPSATFHAPYGAAKAGVIALTRSMAAELGQYGIRANVVVPGATKTARATGLLGERMETRYAAWNPLGRTTAPQEVAESIAFLLSGKASGITGAMLTVDSGMTSRCALGGVEYFDGRSNW
jgi:NAD(P)-dependent dehydrogenase (short-subunit alcohol dehydrogenase family)